MSQAARPPHRFLPTLTEVVELENLPRVPTAKAPSADPATQRSPLPDATALSLDGDALIERLMLRLDGPLQADLRNALSALMLAHFQKLAPLLQDEIERSVRLAVEEALTAEMNHTPVADFPSETVHIVGTTSLN